MDALGSVRLKAPANWYQEQKPPRLLDGGNSGNKKRSFTKSENRFSDRYDSIESDTLPKYWQPNCPISTIFIGEIAHYGDFGGFRLLGGEYDGIRTKIFEIVQSRCKLSGIIVSLDIGSIPLVLGLVAPIQVTNCISSPKMSAKRERVVTCILTYYFGAVRQWTSPMSGYTKGYTLEIDVLAWITVNYTDCTWLTT